MEQAIHSLLPAGQGSYSESDVETLVQTITDQIMAHGRNRQRAVATKDSRSTAVSRERKLQVAKR